MTAPFAKVEASARPTSPAWVVRQVGASVEVVALGTHEGLEDALGLLSVVFRMMGEITRIAAIDARIEGIRIAAPDADHESVWRVLVEFCAHNPKVGDPATVLLALHHVHVAALARGRAK